MLESNKILLSGALMSQPPAPDAPNTTAGFDPTSHHELVRSVYAELRSIAEHYFRTQPANHTLQPTVLVHEAFLKMSRSMGPSSAWAMTDRTHFLAVAAKAIRQILIDHARAKRAEKRGGRLEVHSLGPDEAVGKAPSIDVVQLHEALEQLALFDERAAAVVELRFFAGLTVAEVAATIGVSDWTIEHDWRVARAWLAHRLGIDSR